MKKLLLFIALIIFVVVVDQVSKIYVFNNFRLGESVPVIDGFFNLTYVRNTGAAFGFGGGFHNYLRYTLFLALPVGACIWIAVLLYKSMKESLIMSFAYALILGGAICRAVLFGVVHTSMSTVDVLEDLHTARTHRARQRWTVLLTQRGSP